MMNKIAIFAGMLSLVCASAVNAAAYGSYGYSVSGNLISYNLVSAGGVVETDTLDPLQPVLELNGAPYTGNTANFSFDATPTFSIQLLPEYHSVSLGTGGSIGGVTYAALYQSANAGIHSPASYDPLTGHLTGTGRSSTEWGIGSWCNAATSLCSALYSENLAFGESLIDLYFNPSLQTFSGTIAIDSLLKNGTSIHRVYQVNGLLVRDVPIPMTAVLFGSALAGLASVRRRRA